MTNVNKYQFKLRTSNLDILTMDGGLSKNGLKVFCYIGNNVENGNVANITIPQLSERLGIDGAMTSRCVKELEEGLLIKVEKVYGGDRVVLVHPEYFWKGDYSLQGVALKKWIKEVCRPKWGSLLKDTEVFLSEMNKGE